MKHANMLALLILVTATPTASAAPKTATLTSAPDPFVITSYLLDSPTNAALIVDTDQAWIAAGEERLQSWRSGGDEVAYMTQWGGLRLGRGAGPYWMPYNGDLLVAIHDTAAGDPEESQMSIGSGNSASSQVNLLRFYTEPWDQQSVFEVKSISPSGDHDNTFQILNASHGPDGEASLTWHFSAASFTAPLQISPLSTGGNNYVFATAYPVTQGNILSVHNVNTNLFSITHDGAIKSGDGSPEWKLGGVTASGGTSTIEVTINGQKYAITATPIP